MSGCLNDFDYAAALIACARGDRAALRAIYERERRWLTAVALCITHRRELAEEVAEYVLGLASPTERAQVERDLERDFELPRAVYFWQDRLFPLTRIPDPPAVWLDPRPESTVTFPAGFSASTPFFHGPACAG
jgi:hypothetical protein